MKFFKFFLSLIFSLLVLSSGKVSADDLWYCDNDERCEWTDGEQYTFWCGDCEYIAFYQYRTCDDPPFHDMHHFKITKFEKVDGGCMGGCIDSELMEQAAIQIINNHLYWFAYLGDNECELNIQGYVAACWWWNAGPGGKVWFEPCNLQGCCRMFWYICKDAYGELQPPVMQDWENIVPCKLPGIPAACATICE